MRTFICALIIALSVGLAQAEQTPSEFAAKVIYPATYALYVEQVDGGTDMLCTALAFESKLSGESYKVRFVSASHCVMGEEDNDSKKDFLASIPVFDANYYLLGDEVGGDKTFLSAKLLYHGSRMMGEDFSVFEVSSQTNIPTVPLGVDPASAYDQPLLNVANPFGIGKQVFSGYVTRVSLERHIGPSGSDWYHMMLIQMAGTGGGSSGSSLICVQQRAVCGFILGTINSSIVVAAPVSRFYKWYKEVQKPAKELPLPGLLEGVILNPSSPNKPR